MRRILNKAATLAIISTTISLLLCSYIVFLCEVGLVMPAPKGFCYGDSLTSGTSPLLINQVFPYAKHFQEKLRTIPGLESSIVGWKGCPGWTSSALLSEGGLPSGSS